MSTTEKYILTIGGYDPCNGAGITQDIKTMEAHGWHAFSVMTSLTIQNESEIRSIRWLTHDEISQQIDVLLDKYHFDWVKVSLVKDLNSLVMIIDHILERIPDVNIVWDPVQTSSTGFEFNHQFDRSVLIDVLDRLYLATPNWNEMVHWSKEKPEDTARQLSELTNICLKGGHRPGKKGIDTLYTTDGQILDVEPTRISTMNKHGSGCVFTSSLITYLASGVELKDSIIAAKDYILIFLESREGLLGIHTTLQKSTSEIEI